MKTSFPQENKNYQQNNRTNIYPLGNLWSTFNIDLQSNLGVIRLAQKLVTNTTSSDDTDLGLPIAFEYFDDRWFAICGTRVFKNTSEALTTTFSEDASTGAQTNYDPNLSDLEVFDDRLWSSTVSNLYSKATGSGTGTWTDRHTFASSSATHLIKYFKKFDRLYFIDNVDTVSSINAANTVADTPDDYSIALGDSIGELSAIEVTSQFIWLGTTKVSNSSAGNGNIGTIGQWDGISAQLTNEYALNAAGCIALTVLEDIPYAIDSEARILKYTGFSFEEIARLPVDRTLLTGATSTGFTNGRFVHPNGFVATKNKTLLILVNNKNGDANSTINENFPSGIWEVDLITGNCTHRYSPTLKAFSSDTITDFGQNRILSPGGLKMNTLSSASTDGRSTMICGFGYYTDATSTKTGIFIDSPAKPDTDHEGQKRGYVVSDWFESSEVASAWDDWWISYRQFLNSSDNITVKYRNVEESPVEASITWVNTTSFTVLNSAVVVSNYWTSGTGNEVEILQGTGSGACVHITNAVNNAGTWTVTIDEAVTGVTTGTAKARFQKWIKVFPTYTMDQLRSFNQFTIGSNSAPRIQIKTCFSFTGNGEFYKAILTSNEDIIATK